MPSFRLASALLMGFLGACTVADDPPASSDSLAAADSITTRTGDSAPPLVTIPANPADSSTPAGPGMPPVEAFTISETRLGPVRAGMTIAQANAALGGILNVPSRLDECDYVRPRTTPRDVAFMVEKGRISRIDVTNSSTVATTVGARIGDTEERIRSLYAGRVISQPHKYTDGRYLVVTPANPADSAFRIVFETDGTKVLRYRSGIRPAVEYVEGCS